MKKVFKFLILFLIFALNMQFAFCYNISKSELNNYIKNQVNSEVQKKYGAGTNFTTNVTGLPENITINDASGVNVEVVSLNQEFASNSTKRVLIKDSQGRLLKSIPVNVRTNIISNVLVATSAIKFGEELTYSNTSIEKREIQGYYNNALSYLPNGAVTKRAFTKGSIISANDIKQKPVILKNSDIDITFLSARGDVKIKLQGKALQDGAVGETIQVRPNKYNLRTYNATVQSSGEVVVRN